MCLPVILCAQNYEKEGDDLFAQAQYEKAAKKYSAAIELSGTSSSLQAKKEKCTKCASLLSRAKSAEASATDVEGYDKAGKLYSDLFAVHALSAYKTKANALKQKANAIKEERQRAAEQAERERQAKLDAERKAKAEAERSAKLEKERREKERKAEKNHKAKEKEEVDRLLAAYLKTEQEDEERLDEERVLAFSNLKKIIETPLGMQNVKWTDSKIVQKKAILDKYPQFSVSNTYILKGKVSGIKYHCNEICAASFDLNHGKGKEILVVYSFKIPIGAMMDMEITSIREDLKKNGFNRAVSLNYPRVINGITFTMMGVDYVGQYINITFTIRRDTIKRTSVQKKRR